MNHSLTIDRTHVLSAFRDYTDHYDPTNGKIALKIEHTYRVAKLCDRIADDIGLTGLDKDIAWLLGMLHDIGRFEQIRRFNSFIDAETVDHAKFGADLLFGPDRLMDHFVPDLIDHPLRSTIELAIRVHNDFRIPEGLTTREQMFCDLIRDADKIDIFRVNNDFPMEVIYNCSTSEMDRPVAEAVMTAVMEHRCVLRTLKESPIDHVVGHICLFFELVYPISRRITLEQGYLDRLMNLKPVNPIARKQFDIIRREIAEVL